MAEFISASIDKIHMGERLRPIDQGYVEAIAASFEERGQISPIMIRSTPAQNKGKTPYTLIAGGYRLSAARLLGWAEIDAIVVAADQVEAQLLEISENLYRNELNPLDRAIFVMKYRELWEEKHGKIDKNRNLKNSKGHDDPSVFASGKDLAKEVQERLGFGPETYKRATRIGLNLQPAMRQAVRGTEAETNQALLLKFAKLTPDMQVKAAAALKESGDPQSVLALTKPPKPEKTERDPETEALAALRKAWGQASQATRNQFLEEIGLSSFQEAA
ncbi:ParB/RepB/Spo0J family partition protein [Martelella mediterranea]|uniref:ParB family chromosome partitioning protein n=1 Tax=Martelella mediterranea TaxID=293089 RepID=A0A4R3NLV0_9HYPH|nr:ParB/RepB/Spo0J family partition protein [Martelella mediterranea]TCT35408.1 ParB family chromosome partitioning protein [Martelella mediterranea]